MFNKIDVIEQHYQLSPGMVLPSLLVSAVCNGSITDIGWSLKACTIKTDKYIASGIGNNKALSLLDALHELAQAQRRDAE